MSDDITIWALATCRSRNQLVFGQNKCLRTESNAVRRNGSCGERPQRGLSQFMSTLVNGLTVDIIIGMGVTRSHHHMTLTFQILRPTSDYHAYIQDNNFSPPFLTTMFFLSFSKNLERETITCAINKGLTNVVFCRSSSFVLFLCHWNWESKQNL